MRRPEAGTSGDEESGIQDGAVINPKRSWIEGRKAGLVDDWELTVNDSKPWSAEMRSEVTGALASLGAECYRLRVKAPVGLMDALVQDTFLVQDTAGVRGVYDQERDMVPSWDGYGRSKYGTWHRVRL